MKKKKITAISIAIIVIVVALIISLVFVFNKTGARSYNSKLEEAQSYVVKMDYKKAESAYLAAIKVSPKKAKAYLSLANVYMSDGKEEKAISILEQGYKNVDSKEDKQEILNKKNDIKKNHGVINNGGDYVTYNGKSYYWEYHGNSFRYPDTRDVDEGNLLLYDNAVNDLICVDENGNKKTIFSGHSYGDIWIFSNRIFIEKVDDDDVGGDCWPIYSMKLDGTDLKEMDDYDYIIGICDKGLIFTDPHFSVYLMTSDLKKKLLFEGDFICADEDVIYFTSYSSNITTLKSIDSNGENETTLVQMEYWNTVNCLQVIDNDIYFQYGDYYGGKIAKVKKDGTGFTVLDDSSINKFTAYKEKDGKVTFKQGSALNEPFEEDGSVYAYTDKSSKRVKMLSPDEYKKLGTDLQNISYSGDNLYYVVVKWEGDTIYSYSYCKKDLTSNKITVYYNIDVDWA
ncbi:DUF5050 domain-containing protein [uncultured Catenibacterium sp.]|uniref:DUF5050 domain-containing protein n=1 Tax=uncultured Catenibacterium sp. TaxID=286142 RepID=UPI002597A65D|nr:DUF5050 domain-containing protein [uncultured Catenibacterium sp.]